MYLEFPIAQELEINCTNIRNQENKLILTQILLYKKGDQL